jgi:hypothetical protein
MPTWDIIEKLTYNQAENYYLTGLISQADFDKFCYQWRNSVYRFSNLAADCQEPGFTIRKSAGE